MYLSKLSFSMVKVFCGAKIIKISDISCPVLKKNGKKV